MAAAESPPPHLDTFDFNDDDSKVSLNERDLPPNLEQLESNIHIFTIGRMNPPHSGHLSIVEQMLDFADENNVPYKNITVILTETQDKKKNPLHCANDIDGVTKQELLKELINYKFPYARDINIVCSKFPNAPIEILEDGKQIYLFIGEDRKSEFKWIGKRLPSNSSFHERSLDRPETAMSATKMRNYALNKDYQQFIQDAIGVDDIPEDIPDSLLRLLNTAYETIPKILTKNNVSKNISNNDIALGYKRQRVAGRQSKRRQSKRRQSKRRQSKRRQSKRRQNKNKNKTYF